MKKKFNLQRHLTRELSQFRNLKRKIKFVAEDYIGGGESKLIFWNLSFPQVRSVLKNEVWFFNLPVETQFDHFENVWRNSTVFEIKITALHWLEGLSGEQLVHFAKRITSWADQIDNWAESDTLCGIFARIFEISPKLLIPTYKNWSLHKNPWLRRCSMVGIFYYARLRRKHCSFRYAISMVKPHLGAPEYYVQKGVGWTVREIYSVYPLETIKFIKDNLKKIRPDAWYACSEKLPLNLKNKLVSERRKQRKMV